MDYIELVTELFIIAPLFYFLNPQKSILLFSITADSIFSAIKFLKIYLLNINKKEALILNNSLYETSLINRYIYYFLLEATHKIFCLLLWRIDIHILYYILLLSICPMIFNYLCKHYLINLFNIIDNEKFKFYRVIICKQLASIINTLSIICIEVEANIKFTELLVIFDDYNKIIDDIIEFIKNFLIISLINYARRNTSPFYSKLIKYYYNYKTGKMIEKSININIAKERFRYVILHRKWKNLMNNEILQSIIYIYSIQDDGKLEYINKYINKINYIILKVCTIWSISMLIGYHPIAPILSILLYIYKKPIDRKHRPQYLFRLLILALSFVIKNYFLISLLSEFGYIIFYNKMIKSIYIYLYEKIKKLFIICIQCNKYNILLVSLFIIINIIKVLDINDYKYLVINYIFFLINIENRYKNMIITEVIILGMLSNYHNIHLLFIIGINYISINLLHFYGSTIDPFRKNISINLIDSYYPKIEIKENVEINVEKKFSNKLFDIINEPNKSD